MDDQDDRELVNSYLHRRDERSFSRLYRRHTPALYGTAARLCGNDADAQDAVQEAWIRACRILDKFRWEAKFRTWLTGILINCVREQHRRTSGSFEQIGEVVDRQASDHEGRLSIEDALSRLADGYRHVLVLHDIEGFTHAEIGKLLDISEGTSKSQLHRARRAMRELYFSERVL